MSRVIQVGVHVQTDEQADDAELAELAMGLREELLALDVARVDVDESALHGGWRRRPGG
jgi:hypothetical protein